MGWINGVRKDKTRNGVFSWEGWGMLGKWGETRIRKKIGSV